MTDLTPVDIGCGWHPDPSSLSLHADAYTRQRWFDVDQREIIGRSWQWVCHGEKLCVPGAHVTATVAGMPVVATHGDDGVLRAFSNVWQHRARGAGEGRLTSFCERYTESFNRWWDDLGELHLDPDIAADLPEHRSPT